MNLRRKLYRVKPVRQFIRLLKQGTSPQKMAMSITMGMLLGVIPTFGFVAPMCAAIALWLRLNVPLALSVLYLMLPVHIALFVPFLKMGSVVFDVPKIPFSTDVLLQMIRTDWWDTLELLGVNNVAAVGVWLIASVPLSFLLYGLLLTLLKRFKKEQHSPSASY